jgi:alkylation response protein AidB-like acyl-CoA dehydrogenase
MTRTAVTDADFYLIEQTLDDDGRRLLRRVREFMEKTVQPVINHYWTREEFPFDLMDGFRQLGIPATFSRATAARARTTCWTA